MSSLESPVRFTYSADASGGDTRCLAVPNNREEDRWERAKSIVSESVGQLSFETLNPNYA